MERLLRTVLIPSTACPRQSSNVLQVTIPHSHTDSPLQASWSSHHTTTHPECQIWSMKTDVFIWVWANLSLLGPHPLFPFRMWMLILYHNILEVCNFLISQGSQVKGTLSLIKDIGFWLLSSVGTVETGASYNECSVHYKIIISPCGTGWECYGLSGKYPPPPGSPVWTLAR